MFRILLLVCGLAAAPALAQAPCPGGPEALDAGVVVAFDGLSVTYRREADGRVREVETYEGDDETLVYVGHANGLMLESWVEMAGGKPDPDTRETYSYDFDAGFPEPRPGATWTGTETSFVDGTFAQARVTWAFGKAEAVDIGGCRYEGLRMVETRLPDDGGPQWINHYLHLRDLGMTLYLGGDEVGSEPVLETPLAISGLR